jgi:hypothetical protein
MFTLAEHLEGMGSRMAAHSRRLHVGRESFLAAATAYQSTYVVLLNMSDCILNDLLAVEIDLYSDGEGGIKVTFQVSKTPISAKNREPKVLGVCVV